MILLDGQAIKATIFPDQTSQVWKIDKAVLDTADKRGYCEVTWEFEYENELMHVAQLKTLLDSYNIDAVLKMPYLPYARQDKRVSNETTFALRTFAKLVNAMGPWLRVEVVDAHNNARAHLIDNLDDVCARDQMFAAIEAVGAAYALFPDQGAMNRYFAYFHNGPSFVTADKVRDQSTGEITGMSLDYKFRGANRTVLIVDDLCDGGRTFVEAAKLAYAAGASAVHLYVSHGIFSKGLEPLKEADIKRIFTRKGEVL